MVRLPQPGSDKGQWGGILNDFLLASHNIDGTVKANTITGAMVQNSSLSTSNTAGLQTALNNKIGTSGPAADSGAVFWGVWQVGNDPIPPNDGKVHWGFRIIG